MDTVNSQFELQRRVPGGRDRRPISQEEHAALLEAVVGLKALVVIEERFNLLLGNYFDFERALLTIGLERAVFQSTDLNLFRDIYYEVNRVILNVSAAGRLYLDHVPHQLRLLPQAVSGAQSVFDAAKMTQYRERLGYRVLEALRNYIQHREFPAHIVTPGSRRDPHATRHRVLYYVMPHLLVSRLREDGKFKAAVLAELAALGPNEVPLTPLIREFIVGIGHVHSAVRSFLASHHDRWRRLVLATLDSFAPTETGQRGLVSLVRLGDDSRASESHWIVRDNCDRIKWLQDRNSDPTHYDVVAVTSAADDER